MTDPERGRHREPAARRGRYRRIRRRPWNRCRGQGYPSRSYADPARSAETKRTQPSTQAGHWYAQAVLAAMRLRSKRPELRSVIALPHFSRYRDLYAETKGSLDAAYIELWWVNDRGEVSES